MRRLQRIFTSPREGSRHRLPGRGIATQMATLPIISNPAQVTLPSRSRCTMTMSKTTTNAAVARQHQATSDLGYTLTRKGDLRMTVPPAEQSRPVRRRPAERGRALRRIQTERAARRSAVLTMLGTVLPGAGLTRTRYFRLGWIVLSLVAAVLAVIVVAVFSKGATATVLSVAVRPGALLLAAVLLALSGLVWVWTIVLTHRGTRDRRFDSVQRAGLRLLTAAMCVIVAVPMATAVRYSLVQRDVIATVFTDDGDPNSDTAQPGSGDDPWENAPRVTVLLLGSDAGDDRVGIRTDSMIMASTNTKTGDTVLFSLPRNLQNVPFPANNPLSKVWPKGYNCGAECLLNGVWTAAEERKDLFKNVAKPGLTTIRGVLQEITGLRIDYTVIVDLKGFQSLVDAMGGVTVNVTERLPIQGYHTSSGGVAGIEGWIEPGVQQLDGYHALWFARSRLLSDDYSRMRRQRCLVGKILNQVNPATMVQKYPQLAAVAKENIQTDVPAADLPAWVDLVLRIKNSSTRSLTFTPDNISPANPNFAAIKRMVKDSLNPLPAVGPVVTPTTTPSPTTKAPTKTTGSTSNKSPKPSIGPTTPAAPPSQPVTIDEAC